MDALSLRQGRLLLPSSSACPQRTPAAALLHRRASSNMRSTGTSRAVQLGRRAGARRCIVSASFFGGGRTAVKKDSNNKGTSTPLKTDNVNCRIFTAEGECTSLELLLSFFGDQGYEVGSPVDLSTFKSKNWMENGEKLGVMYEGFATVPLGARLELVGMRVKPKAETEKEFINEIDITFTTEAGASFRINTTPNTWVHKNQGTRVFYATGTAYLPADTPDALKKWREAELVEIKGSWTERAVQRQEWDRIYDYDVYNDLAGKNKAGELEKRAILGGSAEYPYPRRIRTGRPLIPGPVPGTIYESRTSDSGPWIPLDERFNSTKQANFNTYSILAVIPAVGKILKQVLVKDLTTFKQVDEMYAKLKNTPNDKLLTVEEVDTAIKEDGGGFSNRALKAFKIDPDYISKLKVGLQGALSSVNAIKDMVGGLGNLLDFPPPLVVQDRGKEWMQDSEWGRQALAGVNPSMVTAVTSRAQLGELITDAHLTPSLEGASVNDLIVASETQPRLLVIDLTPVFKDYVEKLTRTVANLVNKAEGRYGYYGRAVLYRGNDKLWRPIAIELHGGEGESDVYTPADAYNLWLLAKGVFSSIDSGFHQLVTHWLRTHACTEPYIISTHRNLSSLHPVYKLMMPHWAFTMEINANARSSLINAGGIIEQCFTPGSFAMEMSSKVYKAVWQFDTQGLPNDLIARGLAKKDEQGKVKLLLEDYPYADDGMLLWDAVDSWLGDYLGLYYDDSKVLADTELQAWWKEIKTQGHADKKEGWPELNTVADLKQILGTMIWIVSGHHSAINFSQYGYTGYILNRPNVCTKKIPPRGSDKYKELVKSGSVLDKVGERIYLETLNTDFSLQAVLTVELLSTHADNEVYLGDPNNKYIVDPVALEKYKKFVAKIKDVEKEIGARNKRKDLKLRSGLAYELLAPTSGPGITSRGVPQSISI